jgi:hypothetical protein
MAFEGCVDRDIRDDGGGLSIRIWKPNGSERNLGRKPNG